MSSLFNNPIINQKELIELLGRDADVEPDSIQRLLYVDNHGTAEIMSEAARDFESLLDGKVIKPNRIANAAYKQYFVNRMQDNEEDMDAETFGRVVQYVRSLDEVIVANTVRQAREDAAKMAMNPQQATPGKAMPVPGKAQPLIDILGQK